jgi:hypothetical protein
MAVPKCRLCAHKAWCTWLALVFLNAPIATSQATEWISSITWSTDALSQYINNDNGERLHTKPVVQSSTNFQFQDGFYLNLWGSKSLDREGPANNLGNEIDYIFGWANVIGPVGVDLSAQYWSLSDPLLFRSHGDVVQFQIELNKDLKFDMHTITPFVKIEPTFPLDGSQTGAYLYVGLRHKWNLTDNVAFTQAGQIIYDPGIYGIISGYNFRYDAALAWDLSKTMTIRLPVFRVFVPITTFEEDRTTAYTYGAGFDMRF